MFLYDLSSCGVQSACTYMYVFVYMINIIIAMFVCSCLATELSFYRKIAGYRMGVGDLEVG